MLFRSWQAARKKSTVGRYLDVIQWQATIQKHASWDAERWHEALIMSASQATKNLATHQDDKRALSERNGNAKHRKPKIIMDANEIPF